MFERIDNWLWEHPRVVDYMTVIVPFLFIILIGCLSCGCGTVKEVPVQYVDRIDVRDSTIYVRDTVIVEIPKEIVRAVVPDDTISVLSTSVALSEARLHKGKLHHTLEQKGMVKTKIDTVVTVRYVDRLIEKEVPVEVEVVKYRRDSLFWVSIVFNLLVILGLCSKICLKGI